MRIPLRLREKDGELVEAYVSAACLAPGCHAGTLLIDFVFDTGCSKSFISYRDARHFNIPVDSLAFVEHSYIAGSTYAFRRFPRGLTVAFKDAEDKLVRMRMGSFYAVKPTKPLPEAKKEAEWLPSLLGLDFLVQNGLSFHIDPKKGLAYFEKSE